MYRYHKISVIIIFLLSFISIFFISLIFFDIRKIENFINIFSTSLITFMSITFGFYLASLSILFSSKYLGTLYDIDPLIPTQRKIHTLKHYITDAICIALATIIICFMSLIAPIIDNVYFYLAIFALLITLFIINFVFIYFIFKVFINALITQSLEKFKENKVSFLKEKLTINYVKNDEKWRLSANENKDLIKLFSLGVVNE